MVVLLAVAFALLRGVASLAEPPSDTAVFTERVVVVGVPGRTGLTDTDRAVLGANLDNAQVGAVSVRPRYVGACAATRTARSATSPASPTSAATWSA